MGSSPSTLECRPTKTATSSHSPTSSNSALYPLLFQTIPPERVGLNGEYDHSGLAKRVHLAFQQAFSAEQIQSLCVSQRGRVVVLKGQVSGKLLRQLVEIATKTHGTTDVETYAVTCLD